MGGAVMGVLTGAAAALASEKLFAAEAEQFWGGETGWNDASDAFGPVRNSV